MRREVTSVRLSASEKRQLADLTKERGHRSASETLRELLAQALDVSAPRELALSRVCADSGQAGKEIRA